MAAPRKTSPLADARERVLKIALPQPEAEGVLPGPGRK